MDDKENREMTAEEIAEYYKNLELNKEKDRGLDISTAADDDIDTDMYKGSAEGSVNNTDTSAAEIPAVSFSVTADTDADTVPEPAKSDARISPAAEHADENEIPAGPVIAKRPGIFFNKSKLNIITYISAFILVLASFAFGLLSDVSEEKVKEEAQKMRTGSSAYSFAAEKGKELENSIKELTSSVSDKQAELKTLNDFAENSGELAEELQNAQNDLDNANSSNKDKENTLNGLNFEVTSKLSQTISLNPGIYIVGKNIYPGTYKISGSGAVSIASAGEVSKINTSLSSGNPISCKLEDKDTIKLETTATFAPEE